jgi:hypothetical protein
MRARTRRRSRKARKTFRQRLRAMLGYDVLWTVLAILAIVAITAPQMRLAERQYQPGDIAVADVTAPIDLSVPDPDSTDRRRAQADRGVPDVYDYNPLAHEYGRGVVEALFRWGRSARDPGGPPFAQLRAGRRADLEQQAMAAVGRPLPAGLVAALWDAEDGFSVENEAAVIAALTASSREQLVGTIEQTRIGGSPGFLLRDIITQNERRIPDTSQVIDITTARDRLQQAVAERLDSTPAAEAEIGSLVAQLMQPNLTYNSNETQQRRRQAINAVLPAFYEVKRGRTLLRQGDEVTAQKILELQALHQQVRNDRSMLQAVGAAILIALAVFSLWRYVVHYQRRMRYQRVRHLYLLMLVVLVGMVALTRVSLFLGEAVADAAELPPLNSVESYKYAIPLAGGVMLLMLLVDVQVAWAFSAVFAVVLGAMTQDLGLVVYALLGSFAVLYGMSQYKQRTALTRSGLLVGGVNVATVLALALLVQAPAPWTIVSFEAVCALAGGVLVSIVATIALPPLEHVFQSLTDIKLLELSNMNLPLLKELAVAAPGTYHHSVVVGTLAEKGAEAIGVNPLFARVAAYYHDIGKLRQPQYFVENQKDGHNPHDKLSPNMSALILVSHVKDGVAYAREHGLPEPLIDLIPQHHGTRLIRFFYEKARQSGEPEDRQVDEGDFRYPGPKPRSKEAAILMLADSVEAISRTLTDTNPARLRAMIRRTVQEVVDDDQLNECTLTLEDLAKISDAFLGVLAGMHHQRIEYPEPSDAPSPEAAANLADEDRGSQLSDQTYH